MNHATNPRLDLTPRASWIPAELADVGRRFSSGEATEEIIAAIMASERELVGEPPRQN